MSDIHNAKEHLCFFYIPCFKSNPAIWYTSEINGQTTLTPAISIIFSAIPLIVNGTSWRIIFSFILSGDFTLLLIDSIGFRSLQASKIKKSRKTLIFRDFWEAQTGFEPVHQGVADPRLTAWLLRLTINICTWCTVIIFMHLMKYTRISDKRQIKTCPSPET